MSLTITRARVKEKCGIADTTYDATIDNLILELVPAITYAIRDEHVADTGNAGLQAILTLGATEIVCGEFAAQLLRTPGNGEIARLGGLTIEPLGLGRPVDPTGLATQGLARLKPFLKSDPSLRLVAAIGAGGSRTGESGGAS